MEAKLGFILLIVCAFGTAYGLESDFLYILDLYPNEKEEWTEAHNYYRRKVSSPEAADMRLMTWDEELEALAVSVVRTCDFSHSSTSKLRTSVFLQAGENLYAGADYRFSEVFTREGVTKLWYDEIQFYDYASRSCQSGELCGHYTQLAWAKTYKLGCAIGNCRAVANGNPPFLVSCNYGPAGNEYVYGVPRSPYKSGEACSQCDEGDSCIDQLCNNTSRDIPFTTTTSAPDTTHARPGTTTVTTITSADTMTLLTKVTQDTTTLTMSATPNTTVVTATKSTDVSSVPTNTAPGARTVTTGADTRVSSWSMNISGEVTKVTTSTSIYLHSMSTKTASTTTGPPTVSTKTMRGTTAMTTTGLHSVSTKTVRGTTTTTTIGLQDKRTPHDTTAVTSTTTETATTMPSATSERATTEIPKTYDATSVSAGTTECSSLLCAIQTTMTSGATRTSPSSLGANYLLVVIGSLLVIGIILMSRYI